MPADSASSPTNGNRAARLLLIAGVAVGACTSMPGPSARVIVTLAPGVQIADHAAFERTVLARTSVKVTYAAAVSERMHALNVQCEANDPGCARAKASLQASGLFASIADDRRRSGY